MAKYHYTIIESKQNSTFNGFKKIKPFKNASQSDLERIYNEGCKWVVRDEIREDKQPNRGANGKSEAVGRAKNRKQSEGKKP